MTISPYEVGMIIAGYTSMQRSDASASATDAVYSLINQILEQQKAMAVDFTKLKEDQDKAISVLQSLPAIKAQLDELKAKLAAVPHEDPSVQATVDSMAAALEAALPAETTPDAPAVTPAVAVTDPAVPATPVVPATPEPTPAVTAPATTAEPAPASSASAATPTGAETPLP